MNTPLPGAESGLKVVCAFCPQVGSDINQSRITALSLLSKFAQKRQISNINFDFRLSSFKIDLT